MFETLFRRNKSLNTDRLILAIAEHKRAKDYKVFCEVIIGRVLFLRVDPTSANGVCCIIRVALRRLEMLAPALTNRALCCRDLHHERVLVHFLNLVRKSGGHHRSVTFRHIRGNSPRGRASVRGSPTRRSNRRNATIPLARPSTHYHSQRNPCLRKTHRLISRYRSIDVLVLNFSGRCVNLKVVFWHCR
jgi:hypothetical protein